MADDSNRLLALEGESLTEYRYNSFGERIKKVVYRPGSNTGTVTYFLYDGHQLSAEAGADGRITAQYVYLGETAVAKLQGSQIYALHSDHRGAPVAATDPSGRIVWAADYSPYGQARLTRNDIDVPLRLPGQYQDAESGTYYNYYRDYDPQTGRYLTADPVGLAGGINGYAYVGGNPLSFIDPLGLTAQSLGTISGGGSNSLSATDDCPDGDGLSTLDHVHLALGVLSIAMDASVLGAPFSWVPDLLDGMISLGEGDFVGAGLSLGAMLPVAGNVGNGVKIARIAARTTPPRQTTILGENMRDRVIPFAEATNARTLPFGTTAERWAQMTPQQRWKLNDGALRARINEGDSFRYIGIDPARPPAIRNQFDLTRSELLRLNDRGIPYQTVTPQEVISTLGRP